MLIPFPDRHSAAFGTTQTGKTYGVQMSVQAQRGGAIFYNTNRSGGFGRSWTRADINSDFDALMAAIRAGDKINYVPDRATRWAEVATITEAMLQYDRLDCRIVFDEVHLAFMDAGGDKHKRAAQASMIEVATTGLSRGLKAVYITQRPALLPNTLMTQSEYKVFYRTEDEGPYLQRYGIPYEDLAARLDAGGQYAYVTRYRGVTEGAFKV